MRKIAIAIDGPAGAGKSTVARLLAQRLGYVYIDTGAMYRAVTLAALRAGADVTDEDAVCSLIADIELNLQAVDGNLVVLLNGKDVTADIRLQEVSDTVSIVAAYSCVRKKLVEQQRKMASSGGVIMDGRDIGTVVLPTAELKIFLTASVEVRAERRVKQLLEANPTVPIDRNQIEESIRKRDELDSTREISPLKKAVDAELLDNSDLTLEETIAVIIEKTKRVIDNVS